MEINAPLSTPILPEPVPKHANQIAQETIQPIPRNSESEIKSVCKLLSQTTYTT
jgi:hypothetical protein